MRKKVLVIGTDGGRRDLILELINQGKAPNMKSLSRWGQTPDMETCDVQRVRPQTGNYYKPKKGPDAGRTFYWKTCPGWSAMSAGVDNNKTRVADNSPKSIQLFWKQCQKHKTYLRIAHDAGYKTLAVGRPNVTGATRVVGGKTQLFDKKFPVTGKYDQDIGILDQDFRDGKIDFYQGILVDEGGPKGDRKNVTFALKHMHEVDVMFVHLDSADQAGHGNGWGSEEQMEAIAFMDKQIGRLLRAIRKDTSADWSVFLTSDHGGNMNSHGEHEIFDQCIPFFSNKYLKAANMRQFDMAPTVLQALGLPRYSGMDGVGRLVIADKKAIKSLVEAYNIQSGSVIEPTLSGWHGMLLEQCARSAPSDEVRHHVMEAKKSNGAHHIKEAILVCKGRGSVEFKKCAQNYLAFV